MPLLQQRPRQIVHGIQRFPVLLLARRTADLNPMIEQRLCARVQSLIHVGPSDYVHHAHLEFGVFGQTGINVIRSLVEKFSRGYRA